MENWKLSWKHQDVSHEDIFFTKQTFLYVLGFRLSFHFYGLRKQQAAAQRSKNRCEKNAIKIWGLGWQKSTVFFDIFWTNLTKIRFSFKPLSHINDKMCLLPFLSTAFTCKKHTISTSSFSILIINLSRIWEPALRTVWCCAYIFFLFVELSKSLWFKEKNIT